MIVSLDQYSINFLVLSGDYFVHDPSNIFAMHRTKYLQTVYCLLCGMFTFQ